MSAGAGRRRRRGDRHDAARLRQPRGPPARPAQVPRRRARDRLGPRRGRAAARLADPRRRPSCRRGCRRGPPRHARRRHRAAGAVGQDRRPRRRAPAHRAARAGRRRHSSPQIRVTARQDLLLCGIAPDRIAEVEDRLRAHGVPLAGDVSALRRLAIACPALPTCGQALGEAERVLPDLVTELEKALADAGNGDAPIRLNMTGCPNGCARPYTPRSASSGGPRRPTTSTSAARPTGDRLAERIRADVPLDQLAAVLAPVFAQYARPRRRGRRRSATGPRRRHRDDRDVAARARRPPPSRARREPVEDSATDDESP